jgi:hypothetical protein
MTNGFRAVAAVALVTGLLLMGEPAFAANIAVVPIVPTNTTAGFADIDVLSATDAWAVGGNGNVAAARYNGKS